MSSFLTLPAELRTSIYHHYFTPGVRISPILHPTPDPSSRSVDVTLSLDLARDAALLLTCRQVYREAHPFLRANLVLDLRGTPHDAVSALLAAPGRLARGGFAAVEVAAGFVCARRVRDPRGLLARPLPDWDEYRGREGGALRGGVGGASESGYAIPLLRAYESRAASVLEAREHVVLLLRVVMACEFMDEYACVGVFELRQRVDEASTGAGEAEAAIRALGLMLADRMADADAAVAPPLGEVYGLGVEGVRDDELVVKIVRR